MTQSSTGLQAMPVTAAVTLANALLWSASGRGLLCGHWPADVNKDSVARYASGQQQPQQAQAYIDSQRRDAALLTSAAWHCFVIASRPEFSSGL